MRYTELNVPAEIHRAVERMGFTELTEVQEKAIPPMMAGRDVIAKAPTGTGKTCAFGIPLVLGVQQDKKYPQAVVMAPRASWPSRSQRICAIWPTFTRISASLASMAAPTWQNRWSS